MVAAGEAGVASVRGSPLDELLVAVDVEGRGGDRHVGHEVGGGSKLPFDRARQGLP
jgi:hypothetical protein